MKTVKSALWNVIRRRKADEKSLRDILSEIPIFEGLNLKELEFVSRILHQRKYAPKELIFKEAEAGNGMYIIKSGFVSIYSEEHDTEFVKLQDGQFFGELSLVDGSPRSASAKAVGDCVLFGFFKPDLIQVLEKNPKIGIKVLFNLSRVLSERLRHTNQQYIQIQTELQQLQQAAAEVGE